MSIRTSPHWIYLVAILAAGSAIRCAHLLSDHYYVLSADSYYFHHLAREVSTGGSVEVAHSGIVYPVGLLARVTSLFFASVAVPLALYAATALLIYWFASRHFGRQAGLCAAMAWSVLPQSYFITAAGYVDRDGLSTLLIASGGFLFLELSGRNLKLLGLPVSWIVSAAVAVGIGQAVYYEWVWAGRWLFAVIIMSIYAGVLASHIVKPAEASHMSRRILTGLLHSPWAATMISVAAMMAMDIDLSDHSYDALSMATQNNWDIPIGEMRRLHFVDVMLWYHPVLLMIGIYGLYLMGKRHRPSDLAILIWFAALLILATAGAKRCLVPALPALSIIIGVGMAPIVTTAWRVFRELLTDWRQAAFVSLLPLVLLGGFAWNAYYQGTIWRMTPGPEWQDALAYLRRHTPPDARILVYGDYGYHVMDLGRRDPVAYGSPDSAIEVVGKAYCAEKEYELMAAMRDSNAGYFVYSRHEYDTYLFEVIAETVCPNANIDYLLENALIWRIMDDEVLDLSAVSISYRNDMVVILKAEYPGQPAENALGQP